jgi:poly-gamma-glutamate capsule biosynthesis protein CapA/YwtB (metallophosphatase superfamily)
MSKKSIIGIVVGILLILAAALGLLRRDKLPEFGFTHSTYSRTNGAGDLASYYNAAQQAAQAHKPETTVSFLAVGDIMLSRNVAGTIAKHSDPLLPFSATADLLNSTDFNFANLESPLSGSNAYNPTGSLIFNAPPADAVGLNTFRFAVLNLANNHAMDQGKTGIDYTKKFLADHNILTEGTGDTLNQAWQPAIYTVKGLKIAFIGASFSSLNDGGKATNNYVARIEDTDRLKAAVAAARAQADFVVVTMHAGTEYTRTPNAAQITFAHAAVDAGADMVIGAHPHWIQTIEHYNGKYIFYSLGNFIFDQMWSQDTREGLALKITLSSDKTVSPAAPGAAGGDELQGARVGAKIKQIELIPLIIDNFSTPRLANETESAAILKKINQTQSIIK